MNSITTPPSVETVWPELHGAIHRAAFSRDTVKLREMLQSGADIGELTDHHSGRGMTVLHTAAFSTVEVVDLLFAHGAGDLLEVPCKPGEEGRFAGCTALQAAAKSGYHEVARRLIHHGANFDAFSAVALGDEAQLRSVYADDKNVLHAKDSYESTLAHWAAKAGNFKILELLCDTGADVTSANLFDETPLLFASAGYPANQACNDLLFEQGSSKLDPFITCALGFDKPLEMMLEKYPDCVSVKDGFDRTPLHWAARNGRASTVEILVANGADVNARDKIGCTPLWHAAYQAGNESIVQLLCENGTDIKSQNIWGKTIQSYDVGEACGKIIQAHRN